LIALVVLILVVLVLVILVPLVLIILLVLILVTRRHCSGFDYSDCSGSGCSGSDYSDCSGSDCSGSNSDPRRQLTNPDQRSYWHFRSGSQCILFLAGSKVLIFA
jgi:hypothetical protein